MWFSPRGCRQTQNSASCLGVGDIFMCFPPSVGIDFLRSFWPPSWKWYFFHFWRHPLAENQNFDQNGHFGGSWFWCLFGGVSKKLFLCSVGIVFFDNMMPLITWSGDNFPKSSEILRDLYNSLRMATWHFWWFFIPSAVFPMIPMEKWYIVVWRWWSW